MTLQSYIVALGSVTNIYEKERWRRVGPKFSNYYEWKPLRLENKSKSTFAIAVLLSQVLFRLKFYIWSGFQPFTHTLTYVRLMRKFLLKLLFEMWHTTRHTPFTVVVELAPLLCNSHLVRYTCRLSSYKAATIVATRYYFNVRLKS